MANDSEERDDQDELDKLQFEHLAHMFPGWPS